MTIQEKYDAAVAAICAGKPETIHRIRVFNNIDIALAKATPKCLRIMFDHIVTKESNIFLVGETERNSYRAQTLLMKIVRKQNYISFGLGDIDDAIYNHVDSYVDKHIMPTMNFYFDIQYGKVSEYLIDRADKRN